MLKKGFLSGLRRWRKQAPDPGCFDVPFGLDGETLRLRPNYAAQAVIEQATGHSVSQLLAAAGEDPPALLISEVAVIIWAAARAANPAEKRDIAELGAMIHGGGYLFAVEAAVELLIGMASPERWPPPAAHDPGRGVPARGRDHRG